MRQPDRPGHGLEDRFFFTLGGCSREFYQLLRQEFCTLRGIPLEVFHDHEDELYFLEAMRLRAVELAGVNNWFALVTKLLGL